MAMVNFVTVRTTPDGAAVSRYRNLLSVAQADVVQHTDAKWYLRGQDKGGAVFYFGATAGYASEAAAVTAILAILP